MYNGQFYNWDVKNNKWIAPIAAVYEYTDYLTGLKYKWSQEANQWMPLNDASKQTATTETASTAANTKTLNAKNQSKEKAWFDVNEERNTNVYVSGLPLDMSEEEFEEMMSKYGIIAKDVDSKKFKVKLYRDENNELKGDGRCCYLMVIDQI